MRLVPTGQSHTKPNYYPYNVIGFLAGHAKTPYLNVRVCIKKTGKA